MRVVKFIIPEQMIEITEEEAMEDCGSSPVILSDFSYVMLQQMRYQVFDSDETAE